MPTDNLRQEFGREVRHDQVGQAKLLAHCVHERRVEHVLKLEVFRPLVKLFFDQLGVAVPSGVSRLAASAIQATTSAQRRVSGHALCDDRGQAVAVLLSLVNDLAGLGVGHEARVTSRPNANLEATALQRVVDRILGLRSAEVQDVTVRTDGRKFLGQVQ